MSARTRIVDAIAEWAGKLWEGTKDLAGKAWNLRTPANRIETIVDGKAGTEIKPGLPITKIATGFIVAGEVLHHSETARDTVAGTVTGVKNATVQVVGDAAKGYGETAGKIVADNTNDQQTAQQQQSAASAQQDASNPLSGLGQYFGTGSVIGAALGGALGLIPIIGPAIGGLLAIVGALFGQTVMNAVSPPAPASATPPPAAANVNQPPAKQATSAEVETPKTPIIPPTSQKGQGASF